MDGGGSMNLDQHKLVQKRRVVQVLFVNGVCTFFIDYTHFEANFDNV